MPDAAVVKALGEAPNPIRQWLFLAAYAGLRACEIAQLRPIDFLLGQSPPVLIIRESKGGDTSTVPIAAALRPIAAQLVALPPEWCFPKGRGLDGHVTPSQVQKRANVFLHELGIVETLHQLRHFYGTKVYATSGRDLRLTQELMRHRSPVSTAGYTYVDPGRGASVLDELPSMTA